MQHCPESGQSNQITEEPIITFHAYVRYIRTRGMGMAERGYGKVSVAESATARSLGYLYLKERQLRGACQAS